MSLINCLSSHGEAISAAMRAFGQLSGEYQKPGLVGGGGGFELQVSFVNTQSTAGSSLRL
jgi:hypothetical protein